MTSQHLDDRWQALTTRLFAQNQFAMKLGLDSMNRALALSGRSQLNHRVVLVAGTNGKGTTASTMSALLSASGLSVGLYTSPHIEDFSERFRIDGKIIARQQILDVAEPILAQFAPPESDPCLTFFELTTLCAVHLFDRLGVDVAIYEVGLGGRLDATNALEPDLSVVTTVGYDHQQYLGESIAEIFAEKLGILRADVPCFVSAQEHEEAHHVLNALRHQPLYCYGRNLGLGTEFDQDLCAQLPERAFCDDADERIWWYRQGHRCELDVQSFGEFIAPYQHRHVATALAAADYISSVCLQRAPSLVLDCASQTLATLRWPGRLQSVEWEGQTGQNWTFICDAAHNADGMRTLCEVLESRERRVDVIIFSALKDKDVLPMMQILGDYARGERELEFICVPLDNPRAASSEQLTRDSATLWSEHEVSVLSMSRCLEMLGSRATGGEALVCGSLYLLGEFAQHMARQGGGEDVLNLQSL